MTTVRRPEDPAGRRARRIGALTGAARGCRIFFFERAAFSKKIRCRPPSGFTSASCKPHPNFLRGDFDGTCRETIPSKLAGSGSFAA